MDPQKFLAIYQELQYKVMFDQLIDLCFSRIGFCETDRTTFWNYALTNQVLNQEELTEIEEKMKVLKRKPAVYFENKKELEPLVKMLLANNFKKDYEDSWMFYRGGEVNSDRFNAVKKVENEEDLEVFLKTFDKCYQEDDSQNPYGGLGDYLKVAKEAWKNHHGINRVEYFIGFKENLPVAVATLNNYEKIGYISNVGSIKEVRGEGFGKLITLYCVKASQEHGNITHCLATEEGTYPNEFYKRIGFETLFTAICCALE